MLETRTKNTGYWRYIKGKYCQGLRSPDEGNVTAADIVKGATKSEDIISYTTGISAGNGKVLNPKVEAGITKELDRDISTNSEDVSKLVSAGTSSSKSRGIDKDDIYTSEDSTRHLEKVQERLMTRRVPVQS